MRTSSRWLFTLLSVVSAPLLYLIFAASAHANTLQSAAPQAMIDALSRANAAVVGVQVTAAEGARSSERLGSLRQGSGVVIGPDDLVLTIGYLMLEAQQIEVITQDNKVIPASAVAYDLATGFGLLKPLLPLPGISPAPLGSTQDLQAGELLMAVTGASTDGDEGEVNMALLVSKRAFSGNWEYHLDTALFTSPPIMSGNGHHSGAALFNQHGELMGIGSLFVMDVMGQNRRRPGNMFVPVDLLKPILAELQQSGSSQLSHRPWLGLTSSDEEGRVQILRVSEDSPAALAGLAAGDVVLAVDDSTVTTLESFYKKLWARAAPDAEVKLTVLQGAEIKTIVLRAQDRMLTLKKASGI